MSKLDIHENKSLVLKNVISIELRGIKVNHLDRAIQEFMSSLTITNAEVYGPLVTYNRGTHVSQNNEITIDYDIMIQAHDYLRFKPAYKVYDKLICEPCIYVRFDDHPRYLSHLYAKLDVFFYEHDLETDESFYSVIINDQPERLVMDIFKPVRVL